MNCGTRQRVRASMEEVHQALERLATAWERSRAAESRNHMASGRRRLTDNEIKELIAAYYFREMMIKELNALFSQRAMAARYHVSKRTIEDWCTMRRNMLPEILA